MENIIIAIDGPAGSGKGTLAKALSEKFNLVNIDTGATYRCVALKTLRNNISLDETDKIIEISKTIDIDLKADGTVLMDGEDAYAQWEGFSGYNASVYTNRLMQGEGMKIGINTTVTILWDGGDFYVVSINGDIGYMVVDQVGTTPFATGGGGGGGGGDWTPPAL